MNLVVFFFIFLFFSGIMPISEAKTVCTGSEKFYKMCESTEVMSM